MNDIKSINAKINKVAKSERVTKVTLGELSRDILDYIYVSHVEGVDPSEDISPINRLLAVLTPMNMQVAVLFFKNFVSWKFDNDACKFTKKNKKTFADKLLTVKLFLDNEDNTIWTWAAANIKIEPKPVDWAKRLTKDIANALDDGLTFQDIMAILNKAVQEEADQVGAKIQEAA